ncbi:MmpS family transport accessory protein [Streptomyces scopuliridis]|uniref:MmpS family transport accessory protein n=1 Tax=Streptomyces scopuliridis TaxID=452529 RepID=UPI0036C4D52F
MSSTESAASTSSTESAQSAEPSDLIEVAEPENAKKGRRMGRGGLAVAAAVLLVCGGLVAYGIVSIGSPDKPTDTSAAAPAADVTYEVLGEGTVEISYRGAGEAEQAETVSNAQLPWKKTVRVPLGASPIVNVTLGEQGGQASCTLAVRGRHVQRATASGAFGRSTCSAELPAAEAPEAPGAPEEPGAAETAR